MKIFKNITPEKAGVPSEAILKYINYLEEKNIEVHSFGIIRDNNYFAEAYWNPYNEKFQHRMFSIGKSFTALGIGFLIEEGKISLDDKISDYFKDKLTENSEKFILEMTIKDLLTMSTCHTKTTYKDYDGTDWVKSFFDTKPTHKSGTVFAYDTSGSLVLSNLIEKLTNKKLMDYLKEKLFFQFDFSKEGKFLNDPMENSHGGSGLVCTMRDLGNAVYFCMKKGFVNNKQLISEKFILEMTSKQISTSILKNPEENYGYGYQTWIGKNNSFYFLGMGGQLGLCIPEYNLIFLVTGDNQKFDVGFSIITEGFYKYIFPHIKKSQIKNSSSWNSLEENNFQLEKLQNKIKNLKIKLFPIEKNPSEIIEKINNKKYIFEENIMGLKNLKFNFKEEINIIEFENKKGIYKFEFKNNDFSFTQKNNENLFLLTSGQWEDKNTLILRFCITGDNLDSVKSVLYFEDNYVTIRSEKISEYDLNNYEGITTGKF